MRLNILAIAGLVCCTLAVAVAPIASNDTVLNGHAVSDQINFKFTEHHRPALESFFTTVSLIPDDILLQGDEPTHQWLVDHGFRNRNAVLIQDDASELPALERRGFWDVVNCASAIVLAIGTTAIPPLKLLKIKKLIDAIGGIQAAARVIVGAQKLKNLGKAATYLAAELTGISTVRTACF